MLRRGIRNSIERTAAFSLAALLLYIPANIYPILRMQLYGSVTENTVWQGCVRLYRDGSWGVALVVFLASIVIPLVKLLGLFSLAVTAKLRWRRLRAFRTRAYILIESIGRWAMLDVFLLAILVALVRLQVLASVIPGRGALTFTLVVICTILASASFDPQLLWREDKDGL